MDIKTGDEVRIFEPRHHRQTPNPEGGFAGRVTKTGRKYATAAYEVTYTDADGMERSTPRVVEFDMETGTERHSVSNFKASVRTPEQAERDLRQKRAREAVRAAGISVDGSESRLTIEQWEQLAELAATFPEYDRSR